jgi:hypothetical protein
VITANKVSFSGIGAWGGVLVLEVAEPLVSSSSQQVQNVDWSTMFGGQGGEEFRDVKANDTYDVYAAGNAEFTSFINDVGETIGSASAGLDAILVKFNQDCESIFLCFYGGDELDGFEALDLMSNTSEIHLVGNTFSSNLGVSSDIVMEDSMIGGERDGIYLKFDSNGTLLFHTYVEMERMR